MNRRTDSKPWTVVESKSCWKFTFYRYKSLQSHSSESSLQQNLDCDQGSKVDIFDQISNVEVLKRSAQDKNCYYAEQNEDQILDKVVLLLQIPAQW